MPSARLDAQWLLAHVLGMPRLEMELQPERRLTAREAATFAALAARRVRRVPLQHLVGTVSFCGIDLAVNRHVLIPRPETERLAELAGEVLRGHGPGARALDIGTGSGCLAIALALAAPGARVVALEISQSALRVARANARRNRVSARIRWAHGDARCRLPGRVGFHLIVSNPPYIATGQMAALQPEVRDHDPRRALDGGPDGLHFYRVLAVSARRRLLPGGCLMWELGDGQSDAVGAILVAAGWKVQAVHADWNGTPRIMVATVLDS